MERLQKIVKQRRSNELLQSTAKKKHTTKSLGSLKPGDWFGEMSCMSPWPRTSTVFSTGATTVLQIGQEVFDDWMEACADFRKIMEEAYISRGLVALLRALESLLNARRRRAPRPARRSR